MMNQMISQNDITASLLDEGCPGASLRSARVLSPHSARMRSPRSASEGVDEDLALLVGEVGADELPVHPVEALAEPVEVRVLGDEEERGRPGRDLLAEPLHVLLGEARAV